MTGIFEQILDLFRRNEIVVSNHGYEELSEDDIGLRDLLAGVEQGVVIENYPDYPKGPCTLRHFLFCRLPFFTRLIDIFMDWRLPSRTVVSLHDRIGQLS